MRELKTFYKLMEGGNVFKGADKQPVTTRVSKGDIAPSLQFLEKILGFKLDNYLGTTGKKDSSGDIDVSVDSSKHDKKEIANSLKAWAKEQGQKPAEWVKLSGDNVHFKLPIKGQGEFVQVDLMFGDPKFQAWSMRGEGSEYKGMYRHVLMASIAKAQGMKWSYKNGLMDRATDEIISKDPKTIVRKILPGYVGDPMKINIPDILNHIYKKFKDDPKKIEALIGEAVATLANTYNVMLPMPDQKEVHESNDVDEYFLARLRDRIVDMDMEPLIERNANPYTDYVTEGKLRAMNHIEDLLLDEGPSGLGKAIKILRSFAEGKAQTQTTIKWDGSPAIIFGRNDAGEFVLTDKSGFAAKGYDGKVTSAKALGQMFSGRKAPMDKARTAFVQNMQDIFDEYKKATPKDFRGYMSGDLMYYNTPPTEGEDFIFTPNVVTYKVGRATKLGQRIGASKTAVVVHNYIGDQFNTTEEAINQIQGKEVFVIPPVYVQTPSKINTKPIDKIESYAKQHASAIKQLFNPDGLKGIANIHALMYKYINNSVDTGLEKLGTDFAEWLNTEKLTDKKRANIMNYLKANSKGVKALWSLIIGIMKLKDFLVTEFDNHPSDVEQSINGQKGGEGYVVDHPDGAVKLVSRGKFTAANRAAHR